ncbi:MAG: PilZ domain-containing protein [Desulfosarcinaceae bacterium]|nr:PilZ domain-containing protein [Desulfosarcinaceae bacterium]
MIADALNFGRRKAPRYRVGGKLFAVITPRKDILGSIHDISQEGVCFSYIAEGHRPGERFEIDLFLSGNGFVSQGLTCETVTELVEFNSMPYSSIPMRRVRAKFSDMDDRQREELQMYLEESTEGLTPDRRCGEDRRLKSERRSNVRILWPTLDRRKRRERRARPDRRHLHLVH